jgi:hypothetical protein
MMHDSHEIKSGGPVGAPIKRDPNGLHRGSIHARRYGRLSESRTLRVGGHPSAR